MNYFVGTLCHVSDSCPLSSDIFLCECSYVICGVSYIYLLDLFLLDTTFLSLDGRTPLQLLVYSPLFFLIIAASSICLDMRVRCSTARRWPDNVGLASGLR